MLCLLVNECFSRVTDRLFFFWNPGVVSYALIPRCRPSSTSFFFHRRICSLWLSHCDLCILSGCSWEEKRKSIVFISSGPGSECLFKPKCSFGNPLALCTCHIRFFFLLFLLLCRKPEVLSSPKYRFEVLIKFKFGRRVLPVFVAHIMHWLIHGILREK
jgi:hypothetical protein